MDKSSRSTDKSSIAFTDLKTGSNIQDIWRFHNPEKREYSYIDPSRRGRNSRIDYWLGSKDIVRNSNSCFLRQAPTPDHKAVVIEIAVKHNLRARVIGN